MDWTDKDWACLVQGWLCASKSVDIYSTEINFLMYSLGGRMQVGNDATPCKNGVLNKIDKIQCSIQYNNYNRYNRR